MTNPRDVIAQAIPSSHVDLIVDGYSALADFILQALTDAGYVVLPREPTPGMLLAGAEDGLFSNALAAPIIRLEAGYRAMVKAHEDE